jgi:hypothetical protein
LGRGKIAEHLCIQGEDRSVVWFVEVFLHTFGDLHLQTHVIQIISVFFAHNEHHIMEMFIYSMSCVPGGPCCIRVIAVP